MIPEDAPPAPWLRREGLLLAALLLPLAIVYALVALRNHALYGTSMDLAIFDQALWHASRFETPASTVREVPSIFGDHLHPAILLTIPVEWVGLGAWGLLALQPFLVLAAAFPIFRFARRRVPAFPATLVALAYALSWGVAYGIGFDWHEFALTAPALALTIERFDARDRRGFWLAALVLLLTKEDQALTLAMFGVLALFRRDRPRDVALPIVAGAAWYLLAVRVAIPLLNGGRAYEHWLYGALAPTPLALGAYVLTHPARVAALLVTPRVKLSLLYRTFGTYAFLPLLSPYAILVVPSLLSRLLSSEAIHWAPSFHYSMPVMAALACALSDTLGRISRAGWASPRWITAGASLALLLSVGMNRGVLQRDQMARPRLSPDEARALDRLLAEIPPDASVAADQFCAAHLAHRPRLFLATDERPLPTVEYVVLDPAAAPGAPRLARALAGGRAYIRLGAVGSTVLYSSRPR